MNLRLFSPFGILLSIATLCCSTTALVGCSGTTETTTATTTGSGDGHSHDSEDGHHHGDDGHSHDDDHAHDDGHDHGDGHEGHDHPAHGPNGGHMVELSGGAHAEWTHDDVKNTIRVFVEDEENVSKVTMTATVPDQEPNSYEFEKAEADGKSFYEIVSPDLLTHVKMGKLVDTKLIITTKDGEVTGQVEHHAH